MKFLLSVLLCISFLVHYASSAFLFGDEGMPLEAGFQYPREYANSRSAPQEDQYRDFQERQDQAASRSRGGNGFYQTSQQHGHPNRPAPLSIVIIGAGPVGLGTAFRYSYEFPHSTITVYEKRLKEIRNYIVVVDKRTRDFIGELPTQMIVDNGPGCKIFRPNSDSSATCFPAGETLDRVYSAPLDVIVNSLEALCLDQGVIVKRGVEVTADNFAEIATPAALVLIATGAGAKSVGFVETIFGPDRIRVMGKLPKPVGYGLAVIFDGPNVVDRQHSPSDEEVLPVSHQEARHYHIDPDADPYYHTKIQGRYRGFRAKYGPQYLAMLLDESEYASLNGKTGSVARLNRYDDLMQLSPMIRDGIVDGFKFYGFLGDHQRFEDLHAYNIRWWAFPIDLTYLQRFSFPEMPTPTFLLGDLNYAPHFFAFSGLNKGLHAANDLMQSIQRNGGLQRLRKNGQEVGLEFVNAVEDERDGGSGRVWFERTAKDLYDHSMICNSYTADQMREYRGVWNTLLFNNFGKKHVMKALTDRSACFLVGAGFLKDIEAKGPDAWRDSGSTVPDYIRDPNLERQFFDHLPHHH